MTVIFTVHFIAILVCSEQIIRLLNAMPYNSLPLSVLNETTTAVPLYNVSKTFTITNNTPTLSTTVSTMLPMTNAQYVTQKMLDTQSSILSKLTSAAVSPIIPTLPSDKEVIIRHNFVMTTAAPPSMGPVSSYHQFDGLSFTGGALVAIGLVVLGICTWKMYIARLERSYWTL